MDPSTLIRLLLLVVLIILSGIFSCSETAIFSLGRAHRLKLKRDPTGRHKALLELLDNPRRTLISILIGNELINVSISALGASLFIILFGKQGKWLAIVVMLPTLLIFAEAIPKSMAIRFSDKISPLIAVPMSVFVRLVGPVRWIAKMISDRLIRLIAGREGEREPGIKEEEFRNLIDAGHKEGVLEEGEKKLIHAVFELGDIPVSKVMTPRTDMFCLPGNLQLREVIQEVRKRRFSRVPIYKDIRDNIIGILYTKDLLARDDLKADIQVGSAEGLLHEPYFVPENKRVEALLKDFRARKIHMAICVDEYGGVEGLVTMEDLLEELFGEIYDEYDLKDRTWEIKEDGSYLISPRMTIEEFNTIMPSKIPKGEFNTVGGFVFHLFGNVPAQGEMVEHNGWLYRAEKVTGARIMEIRVSPKQGMK